MNQSNQYNKQVFSFWLHITQFARAVEYADFISAKESDSLVQRVSENNTNLSDGEAPVLELWKIFGLVWFGLVLWHINHCRLFNAKYSLYIYIKYIWFGLVGFYGISTIVGNLMPNPVYTYILNI